MKSVVFFCIIFIGTFYGCKQHQLDEVLVGKVKLITHKTISKDFAHCSAVIASFGDSAIFAHALPERLASEVSLPLIWSGKTYSDTNYIVTSTTAIQRIITMSDRLGVNRNRLRWYIIAGCYDRGLEEIIPSIQHYNLKIAQVKVDNTFRDLKKYRDITFDPTTNELVINIKSP